MTEAAVAADPIEIVRTEAEAARAARVRLEERERRRPETAVGADIVERTADAIAGSREENVFTTITLRRNLVTFYTIHFCPFSITFCAKFVLL